MTEVEMVRWHHRLNGHEFEQIQGEMDDKRSLVCTVHEVTGNWTRLSD